LGAVDFGIIIDSTIIVMENIYRHLSTNDRPHEDEMHCIRRASVEVGGPMLYSTLIFVVIFLPLFTMKGVEGVIFSPMSHTYAFALTTAILLAVTVSPVLSSFFLKKGMKETRNFVWLAFHRFYHKVFVKVLQWPRLTLALIILIVIGGLSLYPRLGGEFLPKLEEGNIWARATLPLTTSLPHADEIARGSRHVFNSFPEVERVVSQLGRPDDGTDTTGFFNIEFSVDLKPDSQWPKGVKKADLIAQIDKKLRIQFPGVSYGYSQNIEDNIDEALSGVKGSNAVKVYGPDLVEDERVANAVNEVITGIRGITDTAVYRSMGQPNLLITPDRKMCARYGLNVGDVENIVQAAIGGQAITQVLEGDRSWNVVVRYKPECRDSVEKIRNIKVGYTTASGANAYIPLSELAAVSLDTGASWIYHETVVRFIPVKFSVRGRDLVGAVAEAQARIKKNVKFPPGYRTIWAGEFEDLQLAKSRLELIVPASFLLIVGLLYCLFNNLRDCLLALAGIPDAVVGGVLALFLTGQPFSISAAIGFVSLFGVSVMDGILMITFYNQAKLRGLAPVGAMYHAATTRMRPLLMTSLSACIGLLPAAMSHGIGSQVQRPLATVVVGGMLLGPVMLLVAVPALRMLFLDREEKTGPQVQTAESI